MATLLLDGMNDRMVSTYKTASEEEKQQVKQVIEDILGLWTQRRLETVSDDKLQKALEFGLNHETFPLDWAHHKLTREEMNER